MLQVSGANFGQDFEGHRKAIPSSGKKIVSCANQASLLHKVKQTWTVFKFAFGMSGL